MTSATGPRDQSGAVHLASAALPVLDSLPLDRLFEAVRKEEEVNGGRLSKPALEKLDKVYQVKVVRLLASPSDVRLDCMRLDDHLGRVAHDAHAAPGEEGKNYVARWRYLRELLATTLSIRTVESEVADAAPENIRREAWELIARLALQAPREGVPWKQVAKELAELPSVASSKASLSLMLKTLCTAGWIEAYATGREKYVRPGPRIARSAAYAEFAEGHLSSRSNVRVERMSLENSEWGRAVQLLRDYVCFSQGRLIEHFHLANSRHKDIRRALQLPESIRVARTRIAVGRFLGYLNEEFEFVARATFNKLAAHFERRSDSGSRVRMCLKGTWATHGAQVVDIIRDGDVGYQSDAVDVSSNGGFDAVSSTGTYFLANNLPELTLKGRYRNPRIDLKRVEKLREKLRHEGRHDDLRVDETEWRACWNDRGTGGDPSRFYRSTLIVPCTVWNNSLSDAFLASVRRQATDMKPRFERIILGYLCFDHVDVGFFDKSLDVNVGYVAADVLSIFLFARWLLTENSDTYKNALQLLNEEAEKVPLFASGLRRNAETPQASVRTASYALAADALLAELTTHERTPYRHETQQLEGA